MVKLHEKSSGIPRSPVDAGAQSVRAGLGWAFFSMLCAAGVLGIGLLQTGCQTSEHAQKVESADEIGDEAGDAGTDDVGEENTVAVAPPGPELITENAESGVAAEPGDAEVPVGEGQEAEANDAQVATSAGAAVAGQGEVRAETGAGAAPDAPTGVAGQKEIAVASAKVSPSGVAPTGVAPAAGKHLKIRSTTSGCLTDKLEHTPPSRSRSPVPTQLEDRGQESYQITVQQNNIVVNQTFNHACCLSGKTSATVNGDQVVLTTYLFGNPCRCMCSSTIRSSVPLSPGVFNVQIVHQHNRQIDTVHTEQVSLVPRVH